MLTGERIEELARQPKVRRVAVENFLSSLGGLSFQGAKANLEMDAASYRWNEETYGAIWTGILEHFGPAYHGLDASCVDVNNAYGGRR